MAYTTIKKPSDYFNTVTYTGNTTGQTISGVGFQPDWVWIKHRTDISNSMLQDVVRGSTKHLHSNTNDGEVTDATGVSSFNSDGFVVGSNGNVNATGNVCSWNWLADNTSGSSNTDGDITSTVSVNQTSGFSIVKWNTGGQPSSTTVSIGHGLNAVPKFFIVKNLPSADNWYVYHNSLGNTKSIILNSTNAEFTNASIWGSTTPTSSVFSINTTEWGVSTNDKITYCFAEKKGFSKFGSYTGNGSTDGTFVYTGFKPAFVMIKNSSSTGAWYMQDNKRDVDNPIDLSLNASDSNADNNQGNIMDFLSNGIKIRTTGSGYNTSGATYIYMAFADEPLVGDNPATAR